MKTLNAIFLSLALVATAAGCASDETPMSKDEARAIAKADQSWDFCEEFDWYGDGICDDFCLNPDPDCPSIPEPPPENCEQDDECDSGICAPDPECVTCAGLDCPPCPGICVEDETDSGDPEEDDDVTIQDPEEEENNCDDLVGIFCLEDSECGGDNLCHEGICTPAECVSAEAL